MKTIVTVLLFVYINQIQTTPFEQFLRKIPDGWSSNIDNNQLIISRNYPVKIQYFNYGMEANPPILEHNIEIVIECKKKLTNREIEERKNKKDRLLSIYRQRFELEPTKRNWGKYEMIRMEVNTNKKYRVPIYTEDKNSYYLKDNFPYGYIYINELEKSEIEELISKLIKQE